MKTKILYIITSEPQDIYLEQLHVSIASARKYIPKAHITILMDKKTHENIISSKRKFQIERADEIIVIDLDPSMSAQKRSRILKTGARKYIKGDFLFIDCDTIITKDLSDIDNCEFELAACWDTHTLFKDNPYRRMCLSHTSKLGYDISNEEVYFNTGVILARDTPLVHKFYTLWNQNYLSGFKQGVTMDQPSFAITNITLDHVVQTLPDIWNCELKHGIKYLKDAKIVHYLCTNIPNLPGEELFILNNRRVLEKIKEDGRIPASIMATIDDPFQGISSVTNCFGSNVGNLFTTISFKQLLKMYNKSGSNMWIENLLHKFNKIKTFIFK
ncbi:MAG: hypothetical protein HDR98_03625 [Bacteroides sp.]|nr:hypothetical protein [Bacteroides sp.]